MTKLVTPIPATVEHITVPKTSQYGDYQSVLFKTSANEKIWKAFDMASPDLRYLTKGTKVQLIQTGDRNGKPTHHVIIDGYGEHTTVNAPPEPQGLEPDQKRAIAAYTQEMAKFYKYCWQQASEQLEGLVENEESVKCAASSLFIAAQKKFSL